MKKIRFIAILLSICFFYSGCTKDNPIILKEVEDVCEQMDDINFMEYCYSKFDVNSDGKVSMTEAAAVKAIYAGGKSIRSLNGIEYFTNLEVLNCSTNKLTSLDVRKNVKLTELNCSINKLTSLDVSKNEKLEYLYCPNNPLEIIYINNKHKDNIPNSWGLPSNAKIEYR